MNEKLQQISMLDIPTEYCEQLLQIGLEPVNFISNLTFFVFGIMAYVKLKKEKGIVKFLLPALLMLVGASSMWWHGHHSQLGDIADTVSILLFASAVALLFFRKLIHSWVRVIVAYCSLLVVTLFAEQLPYLNGSLPYIVLLVGLIIISVVYIKRFNKNKFLLLSSIGVFGLALLFRTLDMASCSLFPIGTHFLWHIFVAIFGYLLILVVGRDQLKS